MQQGSEWGGVGDGKNHKYTVKSSNESKKIQLAIGPDKPERHNRCLNGTWGKYQDHTSYLVAFLRPIVSVMTLQGQQNSLQKSRPINYAWVYNSSACV